MLKKIETTQHKQKRERKKTIIGIAIATILVLSTVGFTLMQGYDTQKTENYKEYSFVRQGNVWQTNAGGVIIETLFLPQEVEGITTRTPYISQQDFSNKAVYFIAKNDLERQATYELSQYLPALRMQYACLPDDNDTICNELPEKTCEDADNSNSIIIIQDTSETTNETKINYGNGCLEIEGNQETLVKATEKVIFIIFGIIG